MESILPKNKASVTPNNSIAIIGMGAIFPESNGLKAYWRLIFNGKDAITQIPEDTHWSLKDYFDADTSTPDHIYCKRGGFIPKISFNPAKYGFPPNNIDATDTSQLLGLMVADMALTDAGYPPNENSPASSANINSNSINSNSQNKQRKKIENHLRTGVILGVTGTQELVIPLGARLYHPVWKKALEAAGITGGKHDEIMQRISDSFPKWQENSFPGLLGNVVAGRIANRLNLGGTNTVVDAACASSLSAIHTACLELASGRCDLCLSGGVDTLNDIFMHMCFSKTGVLSHTSDAKPFSKDADGTVLGEGIGMVVLKRLEDAVKDSDKIYAVIKGVGTSSDGKTGGIYAPDAGGQLRALKDAYSEACIDPHTVELFEAHGTGTRVGDKIEMTALKSLFSDNSADSDPMLTTSAAQPITKIDDINKHKNYAAVGSVKSMIGHAKAAAGAAGLIKAALSLYHKVIPPTLKAQNPDPEIEIINSPFYLNHIAKPWLKSEKHPRRCGVSAFGFGGSNFHLVLEEHNPKKEHVSWDGTVQIAAFSAKTKEKLQESIIKFKESMKLCSTASSYEDSVSENKKSSSNELDSTEKAEKIGWETSKLRKEFRPSDPYRLLIVINQDDDPFDKASEALTYLYMPVNAPEEKTGIFYGCSDDSTKDDQNDNHNKDKIAFLFPGQGSQYTGMGRELISMFPEALECIESAQEQFEQINPEKGGLKDYIFPPPIYMQDEKISEERLRSTDIAQPAIGAVSLAMAKILARFGITPDAVCGHSFGELTALCTADWIDDASFFNLASARGKFMADAAGGRDKDPGSMFAVKASLEEVGQIVKSENLDLIIANINSPNQVVLSGKTDEIKRAAKIFKSKKLRGVQLTVAAAFHSRLVENAVAPFKESVSSIDIKGWEKSKISVFSNTTGKAYPPKIEEIKKLLGEQLINPVRFMSNIESMVTEGISTFIEVGPKTVLTGLTRSIVEDGLNRKNINYLAIDSSAGKKSAVEDLASLLCSLAALGAQVNLEKWENQVKEPEKKMMRIPLTGANIKPKKDQTPIKHKEIFEKKIIQNPIVENRFEKKIIQKPFVENRVIDQQPIVSYSPKQKGTDMNKNSTAPTEQISANNQPSTLVYAAMQMVQKGMESMQELQTRTALAHEKFLDTQAAASRTLQAMMEQTRFFAENAIYSSNHLEPVRFKEPASAKVQVVERTVASIPSRNNGKNNRAVHNISTESLTLQYNPAPIHHQHKQPVMTNARPDTCKSDTSTSDICKSENIVNAQTVLLETVSKLTGFPVEMLSLDMDIESDLGIDSIKRVEIVSELEKSIPGADALTPENMGTLRTLKDICDALEPVNRVAAPVINTFIPSHQAANETKQAAPPISANTNLTKNSNKDSDVDANPNSHSDVNTNPESHSDVMAILMETISTLTGFPVEMLTPDMDIESDLGIDSIKRVEILSKLEEKLPQAQQILPEELGQLKTIEQIAQRLLGDLGEKEIPQHLLDAEEECSATADCQKKNC